MQRINTFPLFEFIQQELELDGDVQTKDRREFVFFHLIPFIRRMVRDIWPSSFLSNNIFSLFSKVHSNQQSSLVEAQQHEALDKLYLSEMRLHYDPKEPTLVWFYL